MRRRQPLLQGSRLSERTLNGKSSSTRKVVNSKFSITPKRKKKSMMATYKFMAITIMGIMQKSRNLLLSLRKQLRMSARHLINSLLPDVKSSRSKSASKRLHLLKWNLITLKLLTRLYMRQKNAWISLKEKRRLRWTRLLPRNSQPLMQKSKTLSGIMRPKSNKDLTSSSQVSIMVLKIRLFGSLRTRRIISLQQFGTSVRSLEGNLQQLKHLYGESSRLSQTSFGPPFNLAKIDMQTRARESAVNFGMQPKL